MLLVVPRVRVTPATASGRVTVWGVLSVAVWQSEHRLSLIHIYIEVGRLTEEFFPDHDIRLVAVSDNIDTAEGKNELAPIRNLFNEWYARDISKKMCIRDRALPVKTAAIIPNQPALVCT